MTSLLLGPTGFCDDSSHLVFERLKRWKGAQRREVVNQFSDTMNPLVNGKLVQSPSL
ncbi:MAG: hypothetical protein ACPL8I_12195 [Chloroflexaceae bacterium]